jgi:thioredoxin reductase (NADPH)
MANRRGRGVTKTDFDCVVVGAGPAGLAAGIYAARHRMKVVLLEKSCPGGQILTSELVENYPGFPEGISGADLIHKMTEQASRFGLAVRTEEVRAADFSGPEKKLVLPNETLRTRAVIIATGASPRRLGVPGEDHLFGKGVSCCATCDGPFFRDKVLAVVGGGDTAVQETIFLTRFAKKVYLIHRRNALRAAPILQERAVATKKIEFVWDSVVTAIRGKDSVEAVAVKNVKTGRESELAVDGCFVWVGIIPQTAFLSGALKTDKAGFIFTDARMETSVPGVFAAGDVRHTPLRQVATAVGDGATAAVYAQDYLERVKS